MAVKPGERVGAIRASDKERVELFGYGVYEGMFPAPKGSPFEGVDNPRIKLDDGGIVWGEECWWGSEEQVRRSIGRRQVVTVPPPIRCPVCHRRMKNVTCSEHGADCPDRPQPGQPAFCKGCRSALVFGEGWSLELAPPLMAAQILKRVTQQKQDAGSCPQCHVKFDRTECEEHGPGCDCAHHIGSMTECPICGFVMYRGEQGWRKATPEERQLLNSLKASKRRHMDS